MSASAPLLRLWPNSPDHKIEAAWIPLPSLKGKSIPGWLHLPPNYKGGRIPAGALDFGHGRLQEGFVPRALRRSLARARHRGPRIGRARAPTESPLIGIRRACRAGRSGNELSTAGSPRGTRSTPRASASSGVELRLVSSARRRRGRAAPCAVCDAAQPAWTSLRSSKRPRRASNADLHVMSGYDRRGRVRPCSRRRSRWRVADKIAIPDLVIAGEVDDSPARD